MFGGVSSAQAQTDLECVFDGLAGNLTPGKMDLVPRLLSGRVLDIQQGAYQFNGNAICAGRVHGVPRVSTSVRIDSQGYYDSVVCGTGFAHDADGSGTVLQDGWAIAGVGYQIDFAGGSGELFIGPNGAPNHASPFAPSHVGATGIDANHGPINTAYTGRGDVQITPGRASDPPATRDNCIMSPDGKTDSFQVKGHFDLHGP